MEQFFIENGEFILKLVIAMFLGMLIGIERLLVHKEAGMKTHSLVAIGAALFVIVSEFLAVRYADVGISGFNPAMIPANIIVGIGFLGAGMIIFRDSRTTGLTTAGGLWVTAGIGMACGIGLFSLATITTVLVLLIFIAMNILEKPLRKISEDNLAKQQLK